MKVLILSTSPRKASLTLRFSKYLKSVLLKMVEVEEVHIQDFEAFDIPSVGRKKLDPQFFSPFQKDLIQSWNEAHLIIFCSPEYNWTTNGEVFTMIDQLSTRQFAPLFSNKVFSFVGTSSGRGGRLPALEVGKVISKVISFQNQFSIVSPKIFEAHEITQNLNEQSESAGNPLFEAGVQDFIQYTMEVVRRWVILEKFA
jgi:chromate reductase